MTEKRTRAAAAVPKKDPATGTWWFRVDVAQPGEPRKQAKRRGFATKAEAQKALDDLRQKVRAGTVVDSSRLTLGEYLGTWLSDTLPVTVRPSTAYSYRRNLEQHVIPRVGHVRLQALRGPALNKLYSELLSPGANRRSADKGLSPRTVQYLHTVIHRALGDAVRHGLLERNVADLADPPKASANRRTDKLKTWTGAELRSFLTRAESEGDRDLAVWRLLATTGMRRGEALGLRWRDVDLEAGTIEIAQTLIVIDHEMSFGTPKTVAGERSIAIDPVTVAALRSQRAMRAKERLALGLGQAEPNDLVFAEPTGEPLHPEALSKRFDRRAKRYGLPHIGVHGLRHTYCTLALRAGVHPSIVQRRVGHSTIAVTLGTYSHVTPDLDEGVADRLASMIDGA